MIPKEWETYNGKNTRPADFDEFWDETITNIKNTKLSYQLILQTKYDYYEKEVYRVELMALDKTILIGWYICTKKKQEYCLITTHGYRSSKKSPHTYLYWLDSGVDVLVFDIRLQGGETGCNTHLTGPMNEVIPLNFDDIKKSYLYMIYQDMCLISRLPSELGYKGYILEGTSQAGGLAIATGCLMQETKLVMANVPSNSDLDERINGKRGSFSAFQKICNHSDEMQKKVLTNLSYFDTKNMANRLRSPIFASIGGLDDVCPGKAFMATYNRITAQKKLKYYPFSGHEGGADMHQELEIAFLKRNL